MYRHDPQTFEKVIEPILENYPNKQINEKGKEVPCNPFLKYKEEHGEPLVDEFGEEVKTPLPSIQ